MRSSKRQLDQIRPIKLISNPMEYSDGSVQIEQGKTKIITSATIEENVPLFLKGEGTGWVTAEYSMLPRSTETRTRRERGARISGRTKEIQRLIGRSLRAVTDLKSLGERTIIIDCDVIQADGGTRTASVTAGCISLALALEQLMKDEKIAQMPLRHLAGAVSVGIVNGENLLDLDYKEDSSASLDMNVIGTDTGYFVEIQASAEKSPFVKPKFNTLLDLAEKGIKEIVQKQKDFLKKKSPLFIAYNHEE
ncbi:MAG: ribonuclease PH [Candidatus Aminicenantes bacterium]|nr:ribonuclease PH [Candidatus Aminicenantes bacterium]